MQPVERERERREGKMNQEIGHGDQTAGLNRPGNRPDLQPGITGSGQAHRRATGHRITGEVWSIRPHLTGQKHTTNKKILQSNAHCYTYGRTKRNRKSTRMHPHSYVLLRHICNSRSSH
ncbi:hypothetical protein FXW07_01825 [Methanosarcina sp. DH1]|uniref:hypothetical protein n=1 Tax=Methanosarcina sp. DH1 TaxID=2605695 RepID=UPI001E5BF38B|nr:hypothetical protein [Methanosarcina sp. DH1]MCC4765410.1 hypothetical protein [Methanosarcina sp. DH1]